MADHTPNIDSSIDLAQAVAQAQSAPGAMQELAELYRQVDAQIFSLPQARCLGGGVCCRFDVAGHRLYVSTAELAFLAATTAPAGPVRPWRCPYQAGPRCTAHDRRPLGCRVYFCHPQAAAPSQAAYEAFHRLLRELHARHDLPYLYVELTSALDALQTTRYGIS